eukprot:CAMPEP_0172721240 /NCGR_PEP_ID=MMETSP1074-20121228/78627_1 /TAXON_ID=2916 /ORGANISM="Ceratium fusus, Strain PA161109" /LENGTH=252 /DNA_ID=CAMNT_0013546931 /DNA_START=28 /DNA_END=786 /DNA_ORIENTATION=-
MPKPFSGSPQLYSSTANDEPVVSGDEQLLAAAPGSSRRVLMSLSHTARESRSVQLAVVAALFALATMTSLYDSFRTASPVARVCARGKEINTLPERLVWEHTLVLLRKDQVCLLAAYKRVQWGAYPSDVEEYWSLAKGRYTIGEHSIAGLFWNEQFYCHRSAGFGDGVEWHPLAIGAGIRVADIGEWDPLSDARAVPRDRCDSRPPWRSVTTEEDEGGLVTVTVDPTPSLRARNTSGLTPNFSAVFFSNSGG